MKRYILAAFIFFVCSYFLSGSQNDLFEERGDAGSASLFTKFDITARGVSMGGMTVLFSDGAGSVVWNPAGIKDLTDREFLAATRVYGKGDRFYNFVSFAMPIGINGEWGLGVSILNTIVGGIKLYDSSGVPNGEKSYFGNGAIISIGFPLGTIKAGINLKGIWEKFQDAQAFGGSLDIGFIVNLPLPVSIAVAAKDIVGIVKWGSDKEITWLDPIIKFGIGYASMNGTIKIGIGLDKYFSQKKLVFRLGVEYVADKLAFRAGLANGEFSFGAGLLLMHLRVDYAIVVRQGAEELSNLVSVAFVF